MKKTILKIVVSILLFSYIFYTIDFGSVLTTFKSLNLVYLPFIFLFLILNYIASSIRWKFLIEDKTKEYISLPYLVKLYFEGSFFNNFMPTSIGGDVYKVYTLNKRLNDLSTAFVSTFMERFTGVIILMVVSIFGIISIYKGWGVLLLVGFVLAIIVGLYSLKFLSTKIKKLEKIYNSLMSYKDSKKVVFIALASSFIVQLFSIMSQYLIFSALGVNVPLSYALVFLPAITLATFLIPSLNGLGVQDTLYVNVFSAVGVPAEIAVSASIIYHLVRMIVSLIGGLTYAISK